MKKEMNNKGFSLVELIIVIAIMAVLMGILAPQYLKYVKSSKISTDITNAEELATAINVAVADSANPDHDIVAITSGSGFTTGAVVITTSAGATKVTAPDSKHTPGATWVVTFDSTDGVTAITLSGQAIWPDSSAYNTWAKAH